MHGAYLKVVGSHADCGVKLTDSKGVVTTLADDLIAVNKPSELMLLMPTGLADGTYTLTITSQYTKGNDLKVPRSVSTPISIGAGENPDENPDIL